MFEGVPVPAVSDRRIHESGARLAVGGFRFDTPEKK